jgi:putative hemolysin
MPDIGAEVAVILLLLLANGLFAMSEIAVVASSRVRLQQRAAGGDRRAQAAVGLANEPTRFLSTVQVGITLIGILAGAYGGATIAVRLAGPIATVPWLARYADGLALALVVAGITYLSLILGELVPKRIGLTYPETIASWVAAPLSWLARLGGPIVPLLTVSTNLVLRVLRLKSRGESSVTEDEIRALISQGAKSGAIEAAELELMQRVFLLGDQRVAAIMTPRVDIEWIDAEAPAAEVREFLATHRHAQFVVCRGSLDQVVGMVRAADLLPQVMREGTVALPSLMREPIFVPDTALAVKVLARFRTEHRRAAIVLDEFGAVEGLVTLGDLLEVLVGHIAADQPDAEAEFVVRADGSWLVDGGASILDVIDRLGAGALPEDEEGRYHTIAGFVMARLGRVPSTAETFAWRGIRFEVVDMDGRRIDKVLVTRDPRHQPGG